MQQWKSGCSPTCGHAQPPLRYHRSILRNVLCSHHHRHLHAHGAASPPASLGPFSMVPILSTMESQMTRSWGGRHNKGPGLHSKPIIFKGSGGPSRKLFGLCV